MLRFNEGKPQYSRLDPVFIEELAKHMTKSSNKYKDSAAGVPNWHNKPKNLNDILDSTYRHLNQLFQGKNIDSESKSHHAISCAANMMIYYFHSNNKVKSR